MRPKILLLDRPCDKALEILQEAFDCRCDFGECDMVYNQLAPLETTLPVICPCTSVEHVKTDAEIIYLDEAWKRGEGVKVTSTAEHTWSLILQLAKMKHMQLSQKTIGIIGFGRIGKQVELYAKSFRMNTYVWDTWTCPQDRLRLLRESDIITLHVPLNDSTKGMIGKEQFDLMKHGTLLINTSRQQIVDIEALKSVILTKNIYYADDFKDNVDLTLSSNVIQANHIGGNCIEAREATDIYIAKRAIEWWKARSRTHAN